MLGTIFNASDYSSSFNLAVIFNENIFVKWHGEDVSRISLNDASTQN